MDEIKNTAVKKRKKKRSTNPAVRVLKILGTALLSIFLILIIDTGLDFVAAFKMDLYDNLTMTMIDGQNPFAEGETQLQMTRSYD